MTPMIPSNRDLAFDGNLTQARYELHKAIDRGGEAEQAPGAGTGARPRLPGQRTRMAAKGAGRSSAPAAA